MIIVNEDNYKKIKILLIEKRLNQSKIANTLNVSKQRISQIIRGLSENQHLRSAIEEILGEKIWTCETGVTQNNEIVANSHLSIENNKFNNNTYKKDANLVGDQNSLPQENSNINNQNNNRGNTQNTKTRGLNRTKQVSLEAQKLEDFYFAIHIYNEITIPDNQRNKFASVFDELLKKHDKQELREVIKFKIKNDFWKEKLVEAYKLNRSFDRMCRDYKTPAQSKSKDNMYDAYPKEYNSVLKTGRIEVADEIEM